MKIEKRGEFFKVDEAAKVAYGWAIVCADGGKPYVDLQGDHIPEDVMLDAATEFAENSRVAKDMHAGDQVGEFPFIYPVTKSSKDLGIDSTRTGLLVGFKPADPAMLDLIKQGKRTGFSIGGVLTESTNDEIGKVAKSAGSTAKTMRTFRAFKIHEISLVDVPAQEGATVGYVKRAVLVRKDATTVRKDAVLTSTEAGHAHSISLDDPARYWCDQLQTSFQNSEGADNGHSHAWIFDAATGAITIADDSGHTHTVTASVPADVLALYATREKQRDAQNLADAAAPITVSDDPSDGICAPVSDEESSGKVSVVVVQARAPQNKSTRQPSSREGDITMKTIVLTEAQHAHYSKLGATEQEAFVNKSTAERDSDVAKALDADPIVFKGEKTGLEVRKGQGEFALKLAKQAEENAVTMAKQTEEIAKRDLEIRKAAVIAKRTEIFQGKAPGKDEVLDRLIEKFLGDEEALAVFKGLIATTTIGKKAAGVNAGDPAIEMPGEALRKRVEEFRKERSIPTYEQALAVALREDPKARELYTA